MSHRRASTTHFDFDWTRYGRSSPDFIESFCYWFIL